MLAGGRSASCGHILVGSEILRWNCVVMHQIFSKQNILRRRQPKLPSSADYITIMAEATFICLRAE
jgi:hypothetical protein